MIRTALMIAAAALALPTIASAAPKPDAEPSTESAAGVAHAPRYCIVETPTGSNIARRTCKSLEAWLDEGFDPRAKK